MEIIAAVTSTASVIRILENLGLPSAPPAVHSARPPPASCERNDRERECPILEALEAPDERPHG